MTIAEKNLADFWNEITSASIFVKSPPLLIDVRSEGEFEYEAFPRSTNIPILNNEERHQVGLCYKNSGQSSAIALGHELVSGEIRSQRLKSWRAAVEQGCRYLSCWRGGLRSAIAMEWIGDLRLRRLEGGTKALRSKCLDQLDRISSRDISYCVHGRTGSGKTRFLKKVAEMLPDQLGFLDLEAFANHRGSAFGPHLNCPQPQQATFENRVAIELAYLLRTNRGVLVEGEGKLIGKSVLPLRLWNAMREAPVLFLDAPLTERIENIYREYIVEPLSERMELSSLRTAYEKALLAISRKLGGLRYLQVLDLMQRAFESHGDPKSAHFEWIGKLLEYYYDPLYDYAHDRLKDRIIFGGPESEVAEFLKRELDVKVYEKKRQN